MVSYTPDFYLPEQDRFIEVKGRLSSKCRTKLRRFRKFHFEEFQKLTAVIGEPYGKSKSAKSISSFFMVALRMPIDKIMSYTELNQKYKSIIPKWE